MARYGRFWDLHLVGSDGSYDLASSIRPQALYQAARAEGFPPPRFLVMWNRKSPSVGLRRAVPDLPGQGMIVSGARLDDVRDAAYDDQTTRLVRWANDPAHRTKLRVNCHGDGHGNLVMHGAGGSVVVTADALVHWLRANRLDRSGGGDRGLATIALAVCMGGRYGTEPARMNAAGTSSEAAYGSAVARVVNALRLYGLRGIEVTGSNEVVIMPAEGPRRGQLVGVLGDAKPYPYSVLEDAAGWALVTGADGRPRLEIPADWPIHRDLFQRGVTVGVPPRFVIEPITSNAARAPSDGWRLRSASEGIIVPDGWIVDERKRAVVPPTGWHLESKRDGPGSVLRPDAALRLESLARADLGGRSGPLANRLAHSPAKVREVS